MDRRAFLNGLGVASASLLPASPKSEAGTAAGHGVASTQTERTTGRAHLGRIEAATQGLAGQSAQEVARNEDFWREVQQSFSVSRSVVNLNNAGLCACPKVVTDGAQSFGQFDFKLEDLGCDYFGTSLHKWPMAPKGTGLLYVRRDRISGIWPLLPPPSEFHDDVRKFEALGTIPATSLAISEAIAFHNGIGGKRIEERLRYLTRYWVDRVAQHPNVRFWTAFEPDMSCAIATVDIEGIQPRALLDHLWDRHRIRVANPSQRADNVLGVRVSLGLQTTLEELDTFCDVMEGIAQNGL